MNLRVILYLIDFPLGRPPKLPAYIKHNRFIIGLEKNAKNSQRYQDNLCFFRCLAIGKFGKTYNDCSRKAKQLFKEYCDHFQVDAKSFQGVRLEESRSWNSISKFNCMPCHCRKMKQPRHSTCQHFLTLKKFT